MSEEPLDHDQRLKTLFKEMPAELVALYEVAEWATEIDCSEVTWRDKEVFLNPPTGERRLLDLVAQVRGKQLVDPTPEAPLVWQKSLLLIEVDSRDATTALRTSLPDYYRSLRRDSGWPVLPLVVFLRIHLQGRGWLECTEYFGTQEINRLRCAYLGLPALDAWTHVNGSNLLGVALSVFMNIPAGRRAEVKALALQRIATSGETAYRQHLLTECVETYLDLNPAEQATFERLLTTQHPEAAMVAKTSFEKGLEQGLEKGLEKGQRELLQRLLRKRFPEWSATAETRFQQLAPVQLGELAEALLTAQSLRELGLED